MTSGEDDHTIIGIPLGTRLHALVLCGAETHVWIALKNRHDEYEKWQGTYLCVEPNGQVTRITRDEHTEDAFIIKPPD